MTQARWNIETSHIPIKSVVGHLDAASLEDLRRQIQKYADDKPVTEERPAMGELTYRYEHDNFDRVEVVHAYFTNKHGKLARFMRLRRWNP